MINDMPLATVGVGICSFKHKGLKKLYEKGDESKISPQQAERIKSILADLETAHAVDDTRLPGYRLHLLSGELRGFYAVDVSGNWRIIFKFKDGQATDVDLVDYH